MSADDRRRARAGWSSRVFRAGTALGALEALENDALDEWAALSPTERLALAWELSLAEYGGDHAASVEPRLPRSAYRVERR